MTPKEHFVRTMMEAPIRPTSEREGRIFFVGDLWRVAEDKWEYFDGSVWIDLDAAIDRTSEVQIGEGTGASVGAEWGIVGAQTSTPGGPSESAVLVRVVPCRTADE